MTQVLLLITALTGVLFLAIAFYWSHWVAKFFALALFVAIANAVYFSLDGVKGWPAEEPAEVKGHLASVVIVNPSPEQKGGIYISVFLNMPKKWYEYEYPRIAPKTYYVEYTNNRAAQFQKAKQALQEGKEVKINGIPSKEGNAEDGEEYVGDPTDFLQIIGNLISELVPKQKDTYKPAKSPDIEINEPGSAPLKGTNQ